MSTLVTQRPLQRRINTRGTPHRRQRRLKACLKRLTRRCGSFGNDEQLCAVVGGTLAVENPGVRPPVNRLVINYRELANLEWFGQIRPSFYSQDRRGEYIRSRHVLP